MVQWWLVGYDVDGKEHVTGVGTVGPIIDRVVDELLPLRGCRFRTLLEVDRVKWCLPIPQLPHDAARVQ